MIEARTNWTGDNVITQLEVTSWAMLQRMVVYFWTTLQNVLSVPNPRPYQTPSQPGEPPRLRTGGLKKGVLYEFDQQGGKARVGVAQNAIHGVYLEIGTRKMEARPWMLSTLQKILPQLEAMARVRK